MSVDNSIREIEELTATRFSAAHLAKRFTNITELAEERQHGDQVVSIDLDVLPPALWGRAGDFLAACEKAGMPVGKEYGGHKAWKPLTEAEKIQRVKVANERFDQAADRYDAAMVTQTRPGGWDDRSSIENYCERRESRRLGRCDPVKEFKALTQEHADGYVIVSLFERELNTGAARWQPIGKESFTPSSDGSDRTATLSAANQWANQRINQLALGLYTRTITKVEILPQDREEWKQ